MKIKSNIATSGNGFIFNPATGDSFSGNAIASEILAAMNRGETDEHIKADILDKYDVRPDQLEQDWEDWLVQLRAANLLEA
ncbi:PqqD family protein [Mucilaginibacter glaciei]|uniref:PqqD family protein n=1 Tax=Mucilaginibacter glaciei TaxID=2772109 RepID=A0A926NMC4_9SPHI|nr:PqqD family protein [Mucilaginibacter glaciei]MBD1391547.1 PqqD family protein [Mucilaginibacter glaciei]